MRDPFIVRAEDLLPVADRGEAVSHDLVMLLSGGLDSALLTIFAKRAGYHPIGLLIDYGQKHVRELDAAQKLCTKLEIPFRRMKVDLDGVDSALTGSQRESLYPGVSQYHVPGRNTIFVGLAASLAEQVGARKIWAGFNYEDRINLFPDCYQEFVFRINTSLQVSGSQPIELEAPLLGMRKDTIQRWARILGVDETEVHSGYSV